MGPDHDAVRVHNRDVVSPPSHIWRESGIAPVYDVSTSTGEFVAGDIAIKNCDGIAVFTSALLRSIGYSTRILVLDRAGTGFDHAACQVFLADAKAWVFVDATNPSRPMGWETTYFAMEVVN